MSSFPDDLFHLRGRVMNARPEVTPDFVTNVLNDRLRQILDHRMFWADLLKFGILSIPDAYATGTVSLATASNVVTGTDTAWPVNDAVNTTIAAGVPEFGYVEVEPASMAGITANSMLYIDTGADAEAVPVVELRRATFIALFSKTHTAGCTVQQSSLATRQFRLTQAYPVFTVNAVTSATTLLINQPWGGPPLTAQTYQIKLMYAYLANDLKTIVAAKDEQSGYPVRLHVELSEANTRDPRRTLVSGNPWYGLVDLGANEQGNMLYEIWPAPASARQFSYFYQKQWPDMVKDTDRPPPFINPSLLFYGALADCKMMRTSKTDPYYDPEGARYYEGKYQTALQDAKNADEAKKLEALRNPWWQNMMPGNVDTYQLNDPAMANFWAGGM